MKKVILAKHTGRNDDKSIRYWNYSDKTNRWWDADSSKYAIVESCKGLQMVEIIGIAEVREDIEVNRNVVLFISNSDLEKEEDEQVDNQQ